MILTNNQKKKIGFMLAQEFALASPKISTRLSKSFASTMKVEDNTIVFTLPHYAYQVINGSKQHTIMVRDKKTLAVPTRLYKGKAPNAYGSGKFPMLSKDGSFVMFGKKVNHPGNAPNDFLKEVLHQKLNGIIKKVVNS
jgi:hypothetical protein